MTKAADDLDFNALAKTPHDCVCFNVRKASRAITQIYEEELQSVSLRGTQYSMLVAIPFIGMEGVGMLANALVTDRTTVTRNLKPLIAQGLVENIQGPDKRTRGVQLTEAGRVRLNEAYPHWVRAQERILRELGADRFKVVKSFADDAVALSRGA